MDQYQLPFIIALLGITLFPPSIRSESCQVYPSEYAYHVDSFTRTESASANCRSYPNNLEGLPPGIFSTDYIHCDGTQLKLADSDLGREQYSSGNYYVWKAESDGQLLFIVPVNQRVSLTITLHYYSDSVRGRPRLRFYAVPDNFDIWDAPRTSFPHEDVTEVQPGEEPAGRRSISININFNTMKVLIYKSSSDFELALSEVEFFRCIPTTTPVTSSITTDSTTTELKNFTTNNTTMEQVNAETSQATTTVRSSQTRGALQPTAMVAVGVVGILLLILITSLIIILSLIVWYRKRRTRKLEIDPNSGSMREDASYSILERGRRQQIQPQDSNSTELYDQIHLSPSTGQTELISKTESEIARNISVPQSNIYSNVDMENQAESQPISSCEPEKNTLEDATYAVVNKKKKKKKSKGASHDNANKKEKIEKEVKVQEQPSLEEMYAVVQKKPKKSKEQGETPPPIPASTVESLYTAVQKTPQ